MASVKSDGNKLSDVEGQYWECSSCKEEFFYNLGAPNFCPECGEEFEDLTLPSQVGSTKEKQ